VKRPRPHPLFRVVVGGVAPWERGASPPEPLRRTRRRQARASRSKAC
jgi:hypothetical protein